MEMHDRLKGKVIMREVVSTKSYPASIRDYFTNTKLGILACFVMDEHHKTLYENQHYIMRRTQGMETDLDLNTPHRNPYAR